MATPCSRSCNGNLSSHTMQCSSSTTRSHEAHNTELSFSSSGDNLCPHLMQYSSRFGIVAIYPQPSLIGIESDPPHICLMRVPDILQFPGADGSPEVILDVVPYPWLYHVKFKHSAVADRVIPAIPIRYP